MATIEELQADRDAIAAARQLFLTNGQVKQVTRAGRTMIMENATLGDLDRALARIDAQIGVLNAAAGGCRRRRAFTLGFR